MNRKLMSLLLVSSMALGFFSACSAKKKDETKEWNGSWYEMKTFDTTNYGKANGYSGERGQNIISCDEEAIVMLENYDVGYQDISTWGTLYEEKNDVHNLSKYSLSPDNYGERIGYYDFMSGEILDYTWDSFAYVSIINCFPNGDDIDVLVRTLNPSSYAETFKLYKINLESSSIVSEKDVDFSSIGKTNGLWMNGLIKTDSGYVMALTDYSANKVVVHELDNDMNYLTTKEIAGFDKFKAVDIGEVHLMDGKYYYFLLYDFDSKPIGVLYNVETGEMTEQPALESWQYTFLSADKVYYSDSYCIKKYDLLTGQEELVMDYNNCILDRSYVNYGINVKYADDSRLIAYEFSDYGYSIIEFDRLDSNPFEGKTPISVAFLNNNMTKEQCKAMYNFNMQSDDSYVFVDTRYDMSYKLVENLNFDDENYNNNLRKERVEVSNQLMVDILAGEGPDIIFGGYNFSQFNNSNVLIDLNPFIDADENFVREDYFSSIFTSDSDKLYQLPISVGVEALIASPDALSYCNDGYGVTFDNYEAIISDLNNGINPLLFDCSKAEYFVKLFNQNKEHFFENGKIVIDKEYFKSIAEYVYSLTDLNEEDYYEALFSDSLKVLSGKFFSADCLNKGQVILGLPSPEGMNPLLFCDDSVGITTSCKNTSVAWDFVKVLFGDECQKGNAWGAVKRDVRKDFELQWIAEWKQRNDMDIVLYGWGDPSAFRDDVVDMYIDALDSAAGVYSSDTDIDLIIYEEIQAYLAGDKTLDEIIDLISNRVQLVLDERG